MREMTIKVKPGRSGSCLMTGEKAEVNAVIRIDADLTKKGLTELIRILTALSPPKTETPTTATPVQSDQPDLDADIPF